MTRNFLNGSWETINSAAEHRAILSGRVNIGEYIGPGQYWKLSYQQRCPRGCCYDHVVELIPSKEVIKEVKETMKNYAWILKQANGYEKQGEDNANLSSCSRLS